MRTLRNIFFSFLGILALGMFAWLANDIYTENARIQKIKGVDAKVIEQLKKIRTAQEAYLSVKNEYCNDWDSLFQFIAEDQFYVVQKKEQIFNRGGVDSVVVKVDTLSVVAVFDSLQNQLGIKNKAEITELSKVPVSDTTFTIRADKLYNGQRVCEIRDPYPLNPRRQKKGDLKPLQIGSLEISTLQGNWE